MRGLKNMKIGIDISQIVYEGTGVARFTSGLTNAILDYDRKNSWVFFFSALRRQLDRRIEQKIKDKGHTLIKFSLPPTLTAFLFNDLHNLSKLLTFNLKFLNSLDWFITSDWTEIPLKVKKATIVHDLVYLRFPETVDTKVLDIQKKRLSWVQKEAKIIFTDSLTTKNDLQDLLKINPDKIKTIYPGVEMQFPSKEQINLTLKKYNLKRQFILTVGKLEPRKNIKRLIEAFSNLEDIDINLVIVGPEGWEPISDEMTKNSNIRILNFVSDTELFSLYRSCLYFVFPSLWEGFGYPVIEAMKSGTPVATSATSSLKEIGEDAALLFNPKNIEEITNGLKKMYANEQLRNALAKKGLEYSKKFTWLNYYRQMIKVLSAN